MRDINRIEPFLKRIQRLWELYPDLRFGQIVSILTVEMKMNDTFYAEESEWLEAVESILKENSLKYIYKLK